MPWRLIQFIIFFVIFLVFIVLNLDNKCDISFGFKKVENVPVFLTVFITFIAGMLCAFPFVLAFKVRRKEKSAQKNGLLAKAAKKQPKESGAKSDDSTIFDSRHYGID